MSDVNFRGDLSAPGEAFPHFWEHTVGSGHATLALRADWQRQITRCHRELGFEYVRFHGILSDDMGTLVCEMDKPVYSFFNADSIVDFLRSIGMRPFVELSFMPLMLSSGADIVFHYRGNVTPPRDYAAWGELIHRLVEHWVRRYGIEEVRQWYFEVWNEPNLRAFWTGSREDYFHLYQVTAEAIKRVHPTLQVGGPATAMNAWIPEFLDFAAKGDVPVDFVSTHHYPTDAFGKPGDDTEGQLAASRRSVLREQATLAREQARGKPLYYTEWSTSSNPFDPLHDRSYASATIAKTVMEARGLVSAYSYWIFSDIFEENYFSSAPFHGGFGLLTIYGIPKPAYRAYQLLHGLGFELIPLAGAHPTVDAWMTRKENVLKVLVVQSTLPRQPVRTELIRIQLRGVGVVREVAIERVDDDHANSERAWVAMGKPDSLSPAEIESLETASSLVKESLPYEQRGDEVLIEVAIPPQGVACITLEIA